eukprot:6179616-Pleurochrysis_carterae.AAC.2
MTHANSPSKLTRSARVSERAPLSVSQISQRRSSIPRVGTTAISVQTFGFAIKTVCARHDMDEREHATYRVRPSGTLREGAWIGIRSSSAGTCEIYMSISPVPE